jgi:pantothenate kinase
MRLQFAKAFREELGVQVEPRDEIDCLVKGLAFFMGYVESEAYTFHGRLVLPKPFSHGSVYLIVNGVVVFCSRHVDRPMDGIVYPYLLVNIGSGVGFILVHSETKWERVSGTSLGGGTFYGLCHMLTSLTSFDQMLDLAEDGNNVHVDLTVGDIYGGDYNKFGLKSTTIASSFGKAMMWNFPDRRTQDEAENRALKREGSRSLDAGKDFLDASLSSDAVDVVTPDTYEASATAALRKVTLDAGSFGSDVIGGKGPLRSEASQLHSTSVSASHSGDSNPERPAKITITTAQQLIASHPGAGFATPLQPRPAGSGHEFENAAEGRQVMEDGDRAATGHSPRVRSASEGIRASRSGSFATDDGQGKYLSKDVARALLIMISNNIGQLGYLNAVRYNCKHVYFAGNFLRHENTIAMRTLSYAITFWSQGTMEALFLRHEGYCGAVGAFLSTLQTAEDLPEDL